jgi:hypothetical protein
MLEILFRLGYFEIWFGIWLAGKVRLSASQAVGYDGCDALYFLVFVSICIICVLKRASQILRPREVVNWGECVYFGSQVNSDDRLLTNRISWVVVPRTLSGFSIPFCACIS